MEIYTPERAVEALAEAEPANLFGAAPALPAVAVEIPRRPMDPVLSEALSRLPHIAIGVATQASAPPPPAGFDLLVTDQPRAPRPWVSCASGVDRALARLEATIAACPQASVSLVQVLRAGRRLDLASALALESFAFSTLLAGPEFARWLAGRPQPPREVPDSEPAVRLRRHGGTLEITLCRPEVHNAFNASMRDALVEALEVAHRDPSVEAVHLLGAGPSFSSGGDLREFGSAPDPSSAHLIRTIRNPVLALARCPAPVTAFVHGACMGAGIEMSAKAHRVVAHPDTAFALPEVPMGLLPGAGGTATIPRRIGRVRTAYLALSGAVVDAGTAQDWGLIDDVSAVPFQD